MVYSLVPKVGGVFVATSMLLLGVGQPVAILVAVPASAAPEPDSDGDGYSDAVETATHSNPFDKNIIPGRAVEAAPPAARPAAAPDTDGDGLADKDELPTSPICFSLTVMETVSATVRRSTTAAIR